MNLSKNKLVAPTPPEKGSFPLDHSNECTGLAKVYLECLKIMEGVHSKCEPEAKAYLSCRMDKGLMVKEPLTFLGYKKNE